MKELDKTELKRIEGGFWQIILSVAFSYYLVESALNPRATVNAFNEGWAMTAAEDK